MSSRAKKEEVDAAAEAHTQKRKRSEDQGLLCTQCECVLAMAYATDGKSRLCNDCYRPARPGFELKILQLDPDAIWLQWVCPQLGAYAKESTAFASGVASSLIERFLCQLFSLGRVRDPMESIKRDIGEALNPMGLRSGIAIGCVSSSSPIRDIQTLQCANGDISCFLWFPARNKKWSVMYLVMSPNSYIAPIQNMPAYSSYSYTKPGNRHFVVL